MCEAQFAFRDEGRIGGYFSGILARSSALEYYLWENPFFVMATEEKNLWLLDAFALIFAAHYAFERNPRISSKGLNTSVMFGFTNTLASIIKTQKPTHIAVVFDVPGKPSFRKDDFPEYKANRKPTPPEIKIGVPWIIKIIEAMNIPVIMHDGFEADDVIGTLAKKAEAQGFQTIMMTPDKDYAQLVSENIRMYRPGRFGRPSEFWGPAEVCEKWGLERPEQVIDILGMQGDTADNIPGIPGVGEKTAIKFVQDYGSMEGLYENTDKLKGKMKEKVEANQELALLSKKLATIVLDVPVELDEDMLKISEPNVETLSQLFAELEFRTLAQRVLGDAAPAETPGPKEPGAQMDLFGGGGTTASAPAESTLNNIETAEHTYHYAETPEQRAELLKVLEGSKSICFDTETSGLDPLLAQLVGMSFAVEAGTAWYVPVPTDFDGANAIANEFKAVLENTAVEKVGQNLKYDVLVLRKYGIRVEGPMFDTMLAHYLVEPEMRHNMDLLAETYLNYSPVSITKLIGPKGKNQKTMLDVPQEEISPYACEDADITLQLRNALEPMVKKQEATTLLNEMETPLINVLADMEAEGIRLDTESLGQLSAELTTDLIAAKDSVYELAGMEFNIASPKQVGEVLFEHLKVTDKAKKTKTGQYSTSEDVLVKLEGKHPIIRKILNFRELTKLKNTYVDVLPTLVNPNTERLHTNYSQAVAATGRLSSDNPNLQNIPIRTERGREIRKAFVPRNDDYVLLAADYSQIELRIIAELSGDEGMLHAFTEGLDIHASTASKVFGCGLDEVSREMRSKAKAVNFGLAYGQGVFGLAQTLNIPRGEASEIIENYFEQFPRIKNYMDDAIKKARENGYSETLRGRRRYLRDINSANATVRAAAERNAINAPIQGSAADMIKIAMVNLDRSMKKVGFQSKMLLQVHDELVFDALKSELEELQALVIEEMQNAMKMSVPIVVEAGVGTNWLQAH